MTNPLIRVLLIQENPDYAAFLKDLLAKEPNTTFHLKSVATLQQALERLSPKDIDIVLLELSLPDSSGLKSFEAIQTQSPATPVIILTNLTEELTALRAVQKGAQDYLLKAEDEGKLLPRIIRCAIERNRVKNELLNLSFADDLTGLYNRRGFMVLVEQQMKFAKRSKKGFFLILFDLDDFKQINDLYGHIQGDAALTQTAGIFRKCFRQSDIVSRIGGDEFAVLAIEADPVSLAIIYERLDNAFEQFNLEKNRPYKVNFSAGSAYYDPEKPVSFEQLFDTADAVLYQQKRFKSSRQR